MDDDNHFGKASPSLDGGEPQISENMFKKTDGTSMGNIKLLNQSPSNRSSAIDFNTIVEKNLTNHKNLYGSRKIFKH